MEFEAVLFIAVIVLGVIGVECLLTDQINKKLGKEVPKFIRIEGLDKNWIINTDQIDYIVGDINVTRIYLYSKIPSFGSPFFIETSENIGNLLNRINAL